jgi:hypothetical protein
MKKITIHLHLNLIQLLFGIIFNKHKLESRTPLNTNSLGHQQPCPQTTFPSFPSPLPNPLTLPYSDLNFIEIIGMNSTID